MSQCPSITFFSHTLGVRDTGQIKYKIVQASHSIQLFLSSEIKKRIIMLDYLVRISLTNQTLMFPNGIKSFVLSFNRVAFIQLGT